MLVSSTQPQNALEPILVTPSGILILVSPVHSLNAESAIYVTLSGIVILVRFLQLEKALLLIPIVPSFIITFLGQLNLSL